MPRLGPWGESDECDARVPDRESGASESPGRLKGGWTCRRWTNRGCLDGRKKEEGLRDTRLLTTAGDIGGEDWRKKDSGIRCPLTTAGGTFCNNSAVSRGPARQVLLPAGTLMGIEPMGMLLLARPQRQSRVHGDGELPGSSAGQVGALACILWNCGASKSRSHCQLNRWGTFGLPQCLGVRGLTWGSVWDTAALLSCTTWLV